MAVDAIIFDCDGVLLDSNRLKVELFRATAEHAGFAPADVERFSAYQSSNFGTSRHALFANLLDWDLEVRPEVTVGGLVSRYAALLEDRYARCDATPGMLDVVRGLAARMPLFVASGSAQEELREVFVQRGESHLFVDVLGSPTPKAENVASIVARVASERPGAEPGDVVLVGDAQADLDAAEENGVRFVYMDGYSTVQERMRGLAAAGGHPRIDDLRDLPRVLAESE